MSNKTGESTFLNLYIQGKVLESILKVTKDLMGPVISIQIGIMIPPSTI